MKRFSRLFLFSLTLMIGFSGCQVTRMKIVGGDWWNTQENNCPSYFFSKKGVETWVYSPLQRNSIDFIDVPTLVAVWKAKDFIIQKAGKGFFDRLELAMVSVNYRDSVQWFLKHRFYFDTSQCKDIKYVFRYKFYTSDSMCYLMKLSMDSAYKVLSDSEIPKIANTPDSFDLMPIKPIEKYLFKKHPFQFKFGYSVRLVYSDRFLYRFTANKKGKHGFSLTIDAVTGEPVSKEKYKIKKFKPLITPEF